VCNMMLASQPLVAEDQQLSRMIRENHSRLTLNRL